MPQNKPLYIAFEGGEGGGKSTQARMLADRIGTQAVHTFEPGGNTYLGTRLREIMLDPSMPAVSPMAETFMMAADRAQHMEEVVGPSLRSGLHVVAERSFISQIAYQGAGRGFGEDEMLKLNLMNPGLILPDLVLVLTTPPLEAIDQRFSTAGRTPDKIESAGNDFHARVETSYGQIADFLANNSLTSGIHVSTIDPKEDDELKTIEKIHAEVVVALGAFCEDRRYVDPTQATLIPNSSS